MRRVISVLIVGLPIAIAARILHWPEWIGFATAALALLPLARWIGLGTEHAAARVGPRSAVCSTRRSATRPS